MAFRTSPIYILIVSVRNGTFALVLKSDFKYNGYMRPRGRPPTGNKPRLSVRMQPEALRLASEQAKAAGKAVGVWLEEAIREKTEREANNE